MEFRGEVLIKYTGSRASTCWLNRAGKELSFEVQESAELNAVAERAVRNYVESHAMEYIDWFSQGDDWVNCQEGRAKVPADVWHCKITEEPCPIQAQIRLGDEESFFKDCNLDNHENKVKSKREKSPEEYKEGLWGAISSGKYRGYHHDPGSIPCFSCDQSKHREEYHFPWEATQILDHIDNYESARTSKELLFNDIATNLANPICANCFISLENMYPEIDFKSYGLDLSDYYSVEYSYKPNS